MDEKRFKDLLQSVDEMKAHRQGRLDLPAGQIHFVGEPDPREIRKHMKLSQEDFAHLLGISVKTLQNWEQGRREPTGPAVKLLKIAATRPDILLELA